MPTSTHHHKVCNRLMNLVKQTITATLTCTLLLVPVAVTSVVMFQPAVAQAQQDMQAARERFLAGRVHFENEEFKKAAEAFLEAYELSGRTELLYNVGQAYRNADEFQKAEEYFQQYLGEQPDAANADEVVEMIIELQQAMAARMATLQVASNERGRSVFVDDETEARCQTPCTVNLLPGDSTLHVRAKGWTSQSRLVTLEPAQRDDIRIDLERTIVQGELMVKTDLKSGTLRVGKDVEQSLPLDKPVSVVTGVHTIEVTTGSQGGWQGEVKIEADETTELTIPMSSLLEAQKAASPFRAASYGLAGASLAFLTGAIIMGMQASGTHDSLEGQQQAFGGVNDGLLDRGKSQQTSANVLFGASILTLGSAVGLYFWDASRYDSAPASQPTRYPEAQPEEKAQDKPEAPAEPGTSVDLLD